MHGFVPYTMIIVSRFFIKSLCSIPDSLQSFYDILINFAGL